LVPEITRADLIRELAVVPARGQSVESPTAGAGPPTDRGLDVEQYRQIILGPAHGMIIAPEGYYHPRGGPEDPES
jgi:hypothetical protein